LNPLLSGVMLEKDAQDDGRLEVDEIFELKLNAESRVLGSHGRGMTGRLLLGSVSQEVALHLNAQLKLCAARPHLMRVSC
jgi:hypothetical protein